MGRGRTRAGGFGKHRRGKVKPGTKPAGKPWRLVNAKQLTKERNALDIASRAFRLAAELPPEDGGGDPLQLVDRAAKDAGIKDDGARDAARQLVREQLEKMREAHRGE